MLTFAVVIPNLNQSHFLTTALESLRHQSAPFNLAIMDGGSRDGFNEVIKGYVDIIAYLRSAPDRGQADAIQQGKTLISGDVVSWLNADDYYFPSALDKVASCFNSDPDLDVVYGDAIHVNPDGFFQSYFPPIQAFDRDELSRSCFICQPACFIRRSAYDSVGGVNTKLNYTMDWDLWHRLAQSGARFMYLPELLAAVRYYPGTKTLSGNWRRYMEIWRIERLYGKRLFPSSWLGSYLYTSRFKTEKKVKDKITHWLFNRLRPIKKRLFKKKGSVASPQSTLYGFHRWDPVVEGCCIIHFPWYGKQRWKRLHFDVEPTDGSYEISINDGDVMTLLAEGGHISMTSPELNGPRRKIIMQCFSDDIWKLLGFYCELA